MKVISLTNNSTNCYLLPANDGWLLVDTGLPDTFSHLLQLLFKNSISIYEINYLLITHFHPDHAGLVQNLRDLGTNLIVHEDQIPYMQKLNSFYKKNPRANFRDIVSHHMITVSNSDSREFLQSIGISGDIVTTPGHSDDSISLVLDDECAFVGDLPSYHLVEAYNDIVIDDSWEMLQAHNINTIYPGHGEPYQLDYSRQLVKTNHYIV
ncbi:MAG: Zn-dependent hydrolase, glyoxylase [Herbinix sp.]|nr:Zn-dependent hydrolase, glyoxylase [Herbinix sp.]